MSVAVGDVVRVSFTAPVERVGGNGWVFAGGYWFPSTAYEVEKVMSVHEFEPIGDGMLAGVCTCGKPKGLHSEEAR